MPGVRITTPNKKLIVSIGSALVDILIREDDAFLENTCVPKGGMTLVDHDYIQQTLLLTKNTPHIVPGGSACNTAIGIAKLGGNARFIGKLGRDDLGRLFEAGLQKNRVEPILFRSHLPTGRVLSVITPDAQRSMLTYLGASAETLPEELSGTSLTEASIVHIEGYLLFNRDLILAALKSAKKAGAMISLDLASFTVVRDTKKFLKEIVPEYVDILIANEDEALAFTGIDNERNALEKLAEHTTIAALKVGKRGSFIFHDSQIIPIDPIGSGNAVDTTGAGDLWASGFLFGLVNNFPLEKCGALGSACGYEVCQVMGASIPDAGWDRIKSAFETIL
ncbi:MAG: adenosine kinase [Thermodesulfobacteriota bacterium]